MRRGVGSDEGAVKELSGMEIIVDDESNNGRLIRVGKGWVIRRRSGGAVKTIVCEA